MRLSTLDFILREAGANICRNVLMSLACITTVMITLGFSGAVVLGFRNADHVLRRIAQELVVAVYLKPEVAAPQRDQLGTTMGAIPNVQGPPVLVSKEHAWVTFSATIPDSLKGEVDTNPLPDSYMVRVDTPQHVPEVARRLQALPGVEKVNAPYVEAGRAAAILRFAGLATSVVTFLMVLVTTFLVMNTIRLTLYARRQEIRVMQLVGATDGYIRTPFILEGLLLGALGGFLACVTLAIGYPSVLQLVQRSLAFELPLLQPGRDMVVFYAAIAVTGALIGAFGSLVSVRRFLRPVEYQGTVRRLRPEDVVRLAAERSGAIAAQANHGSFEDSPAHRPDNMPSGGRENLDLSRLPTQSYNHHGNGRRTEGADLREHIGAQIGTTDSPVADGSALPGLGGAPSPVDREIPASRPPHSLTVDEMSEDIFTHTNGLATGAANGTTFGDTAEIGETAPGSNGESIPPAPVYGPPTGAPDERDSEIVEI